MGNEMKKGASLWSFAWGLVLCIGVVQGVKAQTDISLDADGIMRVGAPITVVCIGNSITDGYSNTSRDLAWPPQMNKLLGPEYQVVNCGVGGTCLCKNDPASYWKKEVFTKAKAANPNILVIAHGTNDAIPERWDKWGSEFHKDYLDMVAEFRQNGRDPILYCALAPPLFSERRAKQSSYLEEKVIPEVKNIAEELGVRTIDFHTPLAGREDLFPDNVHPNDKGAARMAEIAKGIIEGQQRLVSHISVKHGTVFSPTMVVVEPGSSVELTPVAPTEGTWRWSGPNGFSSTKRVLKLRKVKTGGFYTVQFQGQEGQRSVLCYLVSVRGQKAGTIMPHVVVRGGNWQQLTTLTVRPGQDVHFGPACSAGNDAGTWTWRGPKGFFAYGRQQSIYAMTPDKAGQYGVTYTDAQGRQVSAVYTVKVEGEPLCPIPVSHILNNSKWEQTNTMAVKEGASVTFGPQPLNGKWSWTGPNGFRSNERQNQLLDFNAKMVGEYIGTYTNEAGCSDQVVITLTLAE